MKNLYALLLGSLCLVFSGCQKFDGNHDASLKLFLTDNPFDAEAVNVDIQGVKIKYKGTIESATSTYTGNSDDWVWLDTKRGVYNLLDYQNGKSFLLASGNIPGGQIKEIRFVLGSNNSIVIDGNSLPLTIPSGYESGFKINYVKQLASKDSITVDFDAGLSVILAANGGFNLQPVLQIR